MCLLSLSIMLMLQSNNTHFPHFPFVFYAADANHRLNLFYLANDVIQNCKRKNAIIYRTAFADVLPDAALLVKLVNHVCVYECDWYKSTFCADTLCACRDAKVCKSVDRIFSIWQERNVYPEELISELKTNLQKKDKEKEKEKEKVKEQPPPPGQFLNCMLKSFNARSVYCRGF